MLTKIEGYTAEVAFYFFLLIAIVPKIISGQGIVQSNTNKYCAEFAPCSSDGGGVIVALDLTKDQTITFLSPSGTNMTYARTPKSAAAAAQASRQRSGSDTNVVVGWHGLSGINAANVIVNRRRGNEKETYTGSFVTDDGNICKLHYMNGRQVVKCQHASTFPPSLDPEEPTTANEERRDDKIVSHVTSPTTTNSAPSTIDIMVAWTEKAECHLSDMSTNCTVDDSTKNTMEDLVDLAVAETNTAYTESNIKINLRLVHAFRHWYVEEGSRAFQDTMLHMQYSKAISKKRDSFNADVVAILISAGGGICGLAKLGPAYEDMFSITHYNCATGAYIFGHEIGHNMGCRHDRGTHSACDTNKYPSVAYGWRDPQGAFRDIMAYGCRTDQCDKNTASSCPGIQRFSSSTVTFEGKPTGDEYNNCARQHNKVRVKVENYEDGTRISSPTASPNNQPSNCEDSTRPFLVNLKDRTCAWVRNFQTTLRCAKGNGAVANHCPKTCGKCDVCMDANKRFYLKNGNLKSCEWVRNKQTKKRCKKIGDDFTCRKTCGKC